MLSLDSTLNIPASILFTLVDQDIVLLNTLTKQYYALDEVGSCFWVLLSEGKTLRETYQALLEEYEVEAFTLEQDLLELIEDLRKNILIEIPGT